MCAISALRKVDKKFDQEIVLVEPKDFLELQWASYRSPFDEWVAEGSTIALEPFCDKHRVKHIRSMVDQLKKDQAKLTDGTVLKFSVCLLAVGASIPWEGMGNGLPKGYDGTRSGRLVQMKEWGQKLLNSEKVVIVGGGLIGSELAGDLAVYSKRAKKDTQVTLVHSGSHLVAEIREDSARMIEKKLKKLGVKVILNDKAIDKSGKLVLASTGTELEADEVVKVVGLTAINKFVEIEGALTERGFLNTDEYFRVNGSDGKVFAFGDCCTTLDNAGRLLLDNGPSVAHNMISTHFGLVRDDNLKKADNGLKLVIATVGPEDGVFQNPWFHTQYAGPLFKNVTMMFPALIKVNHLKSIFSIIGELVNKCFGSNK